MTTAGTSIDANAVQDNASRYADMALTANLAATALRIKSQHPDQEIGDRYEIALRKMTETLNTMVDLAQRDRLEALMDHSLGLIGNLEGPQLVARLATSQENDSGSKQALQSLLQLREKLAGLPAGLDKETAATVIGIFKGISRNAMIQAQRAQDTLEQDELFIGSRSRY